MAVERGPQTPNKNQGIKLSPQIESLLNGVTDQFRQYSKAYLYNATFLNFINKKGWLDNGAGEIGDQIIDNIGQLTEGLQYTMSEADHDLANLPTRNEMTGLFGIGGLVERTDKKLERSQDFHSDKTKEGEVRMAQEIVMRNVGGTWNKKRLEAVVTNRIVPDAYRKVWDEVAKALIKQLEYENIMKVIKGEGGEIVLFYQTRRKTVLATALSAEGFDKQAMMGTDIRIVIENGGKVYFKIGKEPIAIAASITDLLTSITLPDKYEAVISGKNGGCVDFPVFGKLFTAGIQRRSKRVVDCPGTVHLQRVGAGKVVDFPAISALEANDNIGKIGIIADMARKKISELEADRIPGFEEIKYVGLGRPELTELLERYLTLAVVDKVPRAKVVISLVKKYVVDKLVGPDFEKIVNNREEVEKAFAALGHDVKNAENMAKGIDDFTIARLTGLKSSMVGKSGKNGEIMFAELMRFWMQ